MNKVIEAIYGVDSVTSSFVVVITEKFTLSINNMGISLSSEDDELDTLLCLNDNQRGCLEEIRSRFKYAKQHGNHYPNLDAETIHQVLRTFGIQVELKDIYYNLDSLCRIECSIFE